VRLADKKHVQSDYRSFGAAPLRFSRVYHSNASVNTARVTIPMGAGWHNFYDRSVQVLSATQVRLHRANGRTLDFSGSGNSWTSLLPAGVLMPVAGGWQYVNHRNTVENYDGNGRLVSLMTGGRVTTMQYDGNSRLVGVINPYGRSLAFAYEAAGRVSTITLPGGGTLNYVYGANNNLTGVRFADGSLRQYAYENASFPNALTGLIDESGRRRLTWGYDASGRPNQRYYGNGVNAVSAVYNGNQVTTTDARGTQRVRSFGVVGARRVMTGIQTAATADSAATSWSFVHDANGNPVSVTTRSGELRQYAADARGRLLSATRGAGTTVALTTQTTWHPVFRKPTQTIDRGVTRNYTIDGVGRVTQATQTAGGVTTTLFSSVYNAQNLLQSSTDARGATTTFTYDAAGNRTSTTDALGQTTYFQNFTAHGQAARIVRSDGVVIDRVFDSRARVASRTVAGLATTYSYDAAGRVTKVTAPDGSWRSISYDSAGLPSGGTNHRGETVSVTRDVAARVVNQSVLSASGSLARVSAQSYNAVGRVAASTDSRGYRTQFLYATDGRPSGVTDPLGRTRTVQLDVLNRATALVQPNTSAMRQITGSATATTTLGYDGRSNRLSVADTRAVPTAFAYNAANQRTSETAADAGGTIFGRNAAGDVVSRTDARAVTLVRSLDSLGRTTAITPPAGTARTYAYVPGRRDGLVKQMTDPSGSTTWTYDSAGRVLTKTQALPGISRKVTIGRDALGRPSSVTYPSGMRVDYGYSADVLSTIGINGTALLGNIAYVPDSSVASGWTWGNGSSYARTFDADGRVKTVTLGPTLRSYTYDSVGQVSGYSDSGPGGTSTTAYGYDEAGQLNSYSGPQGTGGFSYDTNGNRLSSVINGTTRSYTYAAGTNRLMTVAGSRSYSYYNDGNASADGTGWLFYYDFFGRQTQASLTNIDGNVATVESAYNGLGQRVKKAVRLRYNNHNEPGMPTYTPWTTTTTDFFYDDSGRLLGEYGSAAGSAQETVWFNGQPVAVVQGGTVYYISADNLGTPRSIVRPSDNAQMWRWDSDPFGTTAPTNPTVTPFITYNLRLPGQYFDGITGLHYNGMRDYDPLTGRYVQGDPLGLGGGLSRYAYAVGNPASHIDPSGLLSLVLQGGASFVSVFGGEGYLGLYFTLPSRGTNIDFGIYAAGGIGSGYNIGSGWGIGAIAGDINSIRGITYNVNGGVAPAGGTLMFDGNGMVGFTAGPSASIGLSGTYSQTGAVGLGDLGSWLGNWLYSVFGEKSKTCP
jgi:RHS repeat-associated protein